MRVSIVRAFHAVAALFLVVASTVAYAHDGDHTSSPPTSSASMPRAEAVSEHFELVAVARHGVLTIYLDRLRSNDPVAGATSPSRPPPAAWMRSLSITAPTRSPRPGRRRRGGMTSSSQSQAAAQPRC
jgi:cobalt-zinc-cadmium efflux system membrane fusion protein